MAKSMVQQCITQALFDLLEKNEYEAITVKDLVTRAGVCRASFYRNYFTVSEVIDRFLDDVFAGAYPVDTMTAETIGACVMQSFRATKQYRRQLRLLNKRGLLYRVHAGLYRQTLNQIEQLQVLHNRYQPHFFSGASAAMLCAWVENDFAESEEEMTRIFLESLRGYMEFS